MNYYEQNLADYKEELVYHPHLNRRTGNYIQKTGSSIYACTHAVIKPSEDTLQEITALRLLFDMDCASAPHLVELAQGMVRPDVEAGIVGPRSSATKSEKLFGVLSRKLRVYKIFIDSQLT
jgi:hypothetical protein